MSENGGEKKCWMVRAGEEGILFQNFHKGSFVSIGWEEVGDLKDIPKEEIRRRLVRHYPEYNTYQVGQAVGVLRRFRSKIQVGDRVVTYDKSTRKYLRGTVTGDYEFINESDDKAHRRKVEWDAELVQRDALSQRARDALRALMTVFSVRPESAEEIFAQPSDEESRSALEVDEQEDAFAYVSGEAQAEEALERVKDKIMALDWLQMQHLVAAILRAIGYKTKVAKEGHSGMDVIASSNLLILGGQRIVAEVKHRQDTIGVEELREFRGAMSDGDRGLFVSTSGFKKAASAEMRVRPLVELVDLEGLARLVIEHYDNFAPEDRALLPLVKMYWPI